MLIYAGTDLIVGFATYGSYLNLLLVFLIGAVCMISLGLLVAVRTASEELADGLLNHISWTMVVSPASGFRWKVCIQPCRSWRYCFRCLM